MGSEMCIRDRFMIKAKKDFMFRVRMETSLIGDIDLHRGNLSRSSFVRLAIREALKNENQDR